MQSKFLNCREWRSFLNTADSAGPYPGVAAALKAGREWLSGGAASNYRRLLIGGNVNGNLAAGAGKTFGV